MLQAPKFALHEKLPPRGEVDLYLRAHCCGRPVSLPDAWRELPLFRRDMAAAGWGNAPPPAHIHIGNLVVKTGRAGLANLLGFANQPYVTKVQVGDCKVGGVVQKVENPPDLSDTGLLNEIRNIDGNPGATFDLDAVTRPDEVIKSNPAGSPGVLVAGGTSYLEDATADFAADGVTTDDTVKVTIDGEDFEFGIDEIDSPTRLIVHNPFGLVSAATGYTVQSPGTQVRFTKRVLGNSFPTDDYDQPLVAHEAGLLFSSGALFNRITIVGNDNDIGLPLRPDTIDGTAIDVYLQWTITF